MHNLVTLLVVFAMSLAAALAVALLFHVVGNKPNYFSAVAIAVGITAAMAARLVWPVSDAVFPFALGVAVGLSVFGAKIVTTRHNA
jgi:hypothetical protein